MIKLTTTGKFDRTNKFLDSILHMNVESKLKRFGKMGVEALSSATPVRTGTTANSWIYEIEKSSEGYTLSWKNTHENRGVSIALLIQNGHYTRNGGYVRGIDYINPAVQPIFEEMANSLWKEVTK